MSSSDTLFASEVLLSVSIWYSSLSSESRSNKPSMTLMRLAFLLRYGFGWQCFLSSSPHSLRHSAARISCIPKFLLHWGLLQRAGMQGIDDCIQGCVLTHTIIVCDGHSIYRWKRDGVFVAWGMEELDILSFSELAILIECTLVRVILRGHIKGCSSATILIVCC